MKNACATAATRASSDSPAGGRGRGRGAGRPSGLQSARTMRFALTTGRHVSRFHDVFTGAKTAWQRNWSYSERRWTTGRDGSAIARAARNADCGASQAVRRPQPVGKTLIRAPWASSVHVAAATGARQNGAASAAGENVAIRTNPHNAA